MTDRTNPGLGIILTLVIGTIFWGGLACTTGYFLRVAEERREVRAVCEQLVNDGWDIPVDTCVRELAP